MRLLSFQLPYIQDRTLDDFDFAIHLNFSFLT